MKLSYCAVMNTDKYGIWIEFPDLSGCFHCDDEHNVIQTAKEALKICINNIELIKLPEPKMLKDLVLKPDQKAVIIDADCEVENGKVHCSAIV